MKVRYSPLFLKTLKKVNVRIRKSLTAYFVVLGTHKDLYRNRGV